jgi:hypothetical protein
MSAERPSDLAPGYRGALPPRGERLARVWVVIVILGFASMFLLAALNVPSVLFPEPTPVPIPSLSPGPSGSESPTPSETSAPSGGPGESVSASPSVSPAESGSPAPTP